MEKYSSSKDFKLSYNPLEHEGHVKFKDQDEPYFQYIEALEALNPPTKEIVYNFPLFVGSVNIARYLFFYELYKKVLNLSGNIAEIGTYKGASFMFWAKLVKIFEPNNTTQVFGFDWFEGMEPGPEDDINEKGQYKSSYEDLLTLVHLQNLENVAIVNKMDVVESLEKYLSDRPYMRYKLVFIDCGISEVLEKSLELMFPRLVKGGVLIMDHFNMDCSPKESEIIEKYIGSNKVLQMPFNRHSSGYVIKE